MRKWPGLSETAVHVHHNVWWDLSGNPAKGPRTSLWRHFSVVMTLMQASSGWGISVCGHLISSVSCGPVVPRQVVCSAVFLPYLNQINNNHYLPHWVLGSLPAYRRDTAIRCHHGYAEGWPGLTVHRGDVLWQNQSLDTRLAFLKDIYITNWLCVLPGLLIIKIVTQLSQGLMSRHLTHRSQVTHANHFLQTSMCQGTQGLMRRQYDHSNIGPEKSSHYQGSV